MRPRLPIAISRRVTLETLRADSHYMKEYRQEYLRLEDQRTALLRINRDLSAVLAKRAETTSQLESVLRQYVRYCEQWVKANGPFPSGDGRSLILQNAMRVLAGFKVPESELIG